MTSFNSEQTPKKQEEKRTTEPTELESVIESTTVPEFPKPNQKWGLYGEIGVFSISMQGSSHIRLGTPCQDFNDFLWMEEERLLLCAIADGVGSCSQSHWGAETAVMTVLSVLRRELTAFAAGKPLKLETLKSEEITQLFTTAFSEAQEAVEATADRHHRPVFEFQSTLTAAVYDGHRLGCCHIGDDGIVALGTSGNYAMITNRNKGEEANSVVTLQSGQRQILVTSTDITGFLMSTDGVLDSYVMGKGMNNLVYYPFFDKLINGMTPQNDQDMQEAVKRTFEATRSNQNFAKITTDDITVVAVANQALLCNGTRPIFSQREFEEKIEAFQKAKNEKLYEKKAPVQATSGAKSCGDQLDRNASQRESDRKPEQSPNMTFPRKTPLLCDAQPTEAPGAESNQTFGDFVMSGLTSLAASKAQKFRMENTSGSVSEKWLHCRHCRIKFKLSTDFQFCPYCGEELTRRR